MRNLGFGPTCPCCQRSLGSGTHVITTVPARLPNRSVTTGPSYSVTVPLGATNGRSSATGVSAGGRGGGVSKDTAVPPIRSAEPPGRQLNNLTRPPPGRSCADRCSTRPAEGTHTPNGRSPPTLGAHRPCRQQRRASAVVHQLQRGEFGDRPAQPRHDQQHSAGRPGAATQAETSATRGSPAPSSRRSRQLRASGNN